MLLHNFLEFFGREYPDQPFAEFQGQTLTYGEADAWANRFANSLLAASRPRTGLPGCLKTIWKFV